MRNIVAPLRAACSRMTFSAFAGSLAASRRMVRRAEAVTPSVSVYVIATESSEMSIRHRASMMRLTRLRSTDMAKRRS